ncbi:MAG TPA: HWE histidine kinase domain-containing protein, partial [Acetobacteraceae bacterium]|nr:HWE histidine kinase domain-containing protein [Acetobacteraceae bacterium]
TSPIRDESAGIGGLFHPITETTATMLGQRRTKTVRDLTAHLGEARTTAQVFRSVRETLAAAEFDLPFVLIYEAMPEGAGYRLTEHAGLAPGGAASPLDLPLDANAPWPIAELIRSGSRVRLDGLGRLIGIGRCGPYEEPPEAGFALPIMTPGSDIPAAILIAGASSRLSLDEAYQDFYDLVAAAFTAGLARIRGFEEERRRAEALAVSERNLQAAVLREAENSLAFALNAARLGSWKFDLRTKRLTASEVCRTDFGLTESSPSSSYRDILSCIHPADRRQHHKVVRQAVRIGSDFDTECRVVHPDGHIAWIMVRGRASYDEKGKPLLVTGVSLDITERKQAEERQQLLLDELNHRVKNTLATVQSIALQTGRTAESAYIFAENLTARIEALSRAHDLLTQASWKGAQLADIVRQTLTPYASGPGGNDQVTISGPPVRLGPNAAITLNMAFHELAANAARYGSLSVPDGQVDIRWRLDRSVSPPQVEIVWVESGGPPAGRPSRRGLGSRLIEQGLARELGGEVRLDFARAGISCRMLLPASGKIEPA